jgi:regulator of protease activity HflC (stomatin/prohibitin superfamily)
LKEVENMENKDAFKIVRWSVLSGLLILVACLWGCPNYQVWQQGMRGKAELSRAEQNRKIAEYDAQASIAKAKGVAEANRIIGESLHDNEAYLRYLWIESLSDGHSEVIYVPTEAGLPILEAGKRK